MCHKYDLRYKLHAMLRLFVAAKTPNMPIKNPQTPGSEAENKDCIPPDEMQVHLSRSACACLQAASPLKADRLSDAANPLHPLLGVDSSGWSLTRVAAISSPRSKSLSRGIGIAADGESLAVSAAWI